MTVSLRRRLLIHLADEGTVEDPAGKVTSLLAEALDSTASRVGPVVRQLETAGLVELRRCAVSGRIFRLALTAEGRAEVGREGHAQRVLPRREVPAVKPVMPVLGPIGRAPFDPEAARERALGGVA